MRATAQPRTEGSTVRRGNVWLAPESALRHARAFVLRSSVHVGSSTILFDLLDVPRGTTGIYLGGTLLGAEWRLSRTISLVIDPADVAFPVPQLAGTPFGYLQYRVTVGVQWGA